jgi:catechol 2,3-dioxygenase-like lactoylglutathione lyase family enzyme
MITWPRHPRGDPDRLDSEAKSRPRGYVRSEMTSTHVLNHVGISVIRLEDSVKFWLALTGGSVSPVRVSDGAHIAALVGYEDAVLRVADVTTPEGLLIELLEYVSEGADPIPDGTAHPGNVHIAFDVDDMEQSWRHAVDCGAVPVGQGPVVIPSGRLAGAQFAYLRSIDGATIELRRDPERPAARSQC